MARLSVEALDQIIFIKMNAITSLYEQGQTVGAIISSADISARAQALSTELQAYVALRASYVTEAFNDVKTGKL